MGISYHGKKLRARAVGKGGRKADLDFRRHGHLYAYMFVTRKLIKPVAVFYLLEDNLQILECRTL
jgi:hypothetical protein